MGRIATGYIRLRCSDKNHTKSCVKLRDAVLDKFSNVREVRTIDPKESPEGYCVSGVSYLHYTREADFREELQNFAVRDGKKTIKIEEVDLLAIRK